VLDLDWTAGEGSAGKEVTTQTPAGIGQPCLERTRLAKRYSPRHIMPQVACSEGETSMSIVQQTRVQGGH